MESEEIGDSIEWVLHLPARGTLYASIPPQGAGGTERLGTLKAGTREFRPLSGALSERWIASAENRDEDAPDGQIEIMTYFVGEYAPEEPDGEVVEGAL